jgi:hypothetical protein
LIYKVDAKIKSIFVPELEKILLNFKSLSGCFHIKEPGPGSATGIHQDPTFVDESKYCSANVWVALQDIDKENGNLFFVSGSNHVSSSLRTTPESPCYYESFYELLPEMAIHVPLKRGEAVIFNNATIHGATENLTDTIRLASTLLVCSYEAQWLLYYKEKIPVDDQIEEYCLDLDAFVAMPKDGRPYSKALRKMFPYKFDKITKEDFLERIGNGRRQKKNYFERIRQAFTMRDGA